MKVHRPATAPRTQQATGGRRRGGAAGVTLLDGRMDPPLVDGLVAGLRARLTDASIKVHPKPSGTNPSPRHVLEDVAAWSEIAIVGTGM